MGVNVTLEDGGAGSSRKSAVVKTNITDENASAVNISGASRGMFVPTGPAISGAKLDESLTLDGLGLDEQMAINASGSPSIFLLNARQSEDVILTELVIFGVDNNIRIENFLGNGSELTNGVLIDIISDGIPSSFRTLFKTSDFELFSTLGGFTRFSETGGDSVKAIRQFPPAFPIRAQKTAGPIDDRIQITIQDNIVGLTSLIAIARGLITKPGVF